MNLFTIEEVQCNQSTQPDKVERTNIVKMNSNHKIIKMYCRQIGHMSSEIWS